jgi:hypothetical protein
MKQNISLCSIGTTKRELWCHEGQTDDSQAPLTWRFSNLGLLTHGHCQEMQEKLSLFHCLQHGLKADALKTHDQYNAELQFWLHMSPLQAALKMSLVWG